MVDFEGGVPGSEEGPSQKGGKESWHVVKEFPIAFIIAMVVQTAIFIAWFSDRAARFESKLENTAEVVKELRNDRYTKDDARRDRDLYIEMLKSLQQKDAEAERRLERLESRFSIK